MQVLQPSLEHKGCDCLALQREAARLGVPLRRTNRADTPARRGRGPGRPTQHRGACAAPRVVAPRGLLSATAPEAQRSALRHGEDLHSPQLDTGQAGRGHPGCMVYKWTPARLAEANLDECATQAVASTHHTS